jgi:uncharacterized protein YajQ (UPF0234 family)
LYQFYDYNLQPETTSPFIPLFDQASNLAQQGVRNEVDNPNRELAGRFYFRAVQAGDQ